MFSSFAAQGQRTLVIWWLVLMALVISLHANSSLLLRRRDKPRLLPNKMMRPRNRTPAVCGIGSICVPGNDSSCPKGGKHRENLLPSCRIRSNEKLHFFIRDLHDDPHAPQVRPVSIQAGPDVPHIRSPRNPHSVKLLCNNPRLVWFVAHHII